MQKSVKILFNCMYTQHARYEINLWSQTFYSKNVKNVKYQALMYIYISHIHLQCGLKFHGFLRKKTKKKKKNACQMLGSHI